MHGNTHDLKLISQTLSKKVVPILQANNIYSHCD